MKARTRELGAAPLPAPISEFIDRQFEEAWREFEGASPKISAATRLEAAAFFREAVSRLAPP